MADIKCYSVSMGRFPEVWGTTYSMIIHKFIAHPFKVVAASQHRRCGMSIDKR